MLRNVICLGILPAWALAMVFLHFGMPANVQARGFNLMAKAAGYEPFKCDQRAGDDCIVHIAEGGLILDHLEVAERYENDRIRIVVDGYCASACTLLVDQLHQVGLACLTENARLVYHQGRIRHRDGQKTAVNIKYDTPALLSFLSEKGGLTVDDDIKLQGAEAQRIYPVCDTPIGSERSTLAKMIERAKVRARSLI